MEELVKLVAERTGLSPEMSEKAVSTVVGYIKERLPEPIAAQVDAVLAGSAAKGGLGDVTKGLGGFLRKG